MDLTQQGRLGGESNKDGHFVRAENLELMTDIFAK